ncbi:hypothetical protein CLU79DRAFT_201784 [Phycomyces nitens]|nr:hypothetical protein CLU79DRAFT_201784 [Phycomyces nitens]
MNSPRAMPAIQPCPQVQVPSAPTDPHQRPYPRLSPRQTAQEAYPSPPITPLDYAHAYLFGCRTDLSLQYHIPHSPVVVQLPIHHTLENATITYDTHEHHQKDLVKDVFFSPAIDQDNSASDLCLSQSPISFFCSSSDSESDGASVSFPSDLSPTTDHLSNVSDDSLFLFFGSDGLDFQDPPPVTEDDTCARPDSLSMKRLNSTGGREQAKKPRISWPTPTIHRHDSNTDYFDASAEESSDDDDDDDLWPARHALPFTSPPKSLTIYQQLTEANIDWCRYCGTTEGVNWRPGPWGKRTLCNKHGCDYKGYGFACKLPRLDLTGFVKESIHDRDRPVLQLFCTGCHRKDSRAGNQLVRCEGCPKAYHQHCYPDPHLLSDAAVQSGHWFCDPVSCSENVRKKRIVVELPRKRLPLMCAPKSSSASSSLSNQSSSLLLLSSGEPSTRTRSLRDAR